VQGPEWDDLAKYSKIIVDELDKTGMVTDLDTNYDLGMPELRVIPDRDKAAAHGVSIASIGETVNAMIGGVLVGQYPKGGHRYDIKLKLEENNEDRLTKVSNLSVRNNRGELIPLKDVVRIEEARSLIEINRRERERAITVYANIKSGESQQKTLDLVESISNGSCR